MTFEGWALLELMGHRTRVGKVSEVEAYGGKLLRIDIPIALAEDPDKATPSDREPDFFTEFYGCASVYALRPLSEAMAADYIARNGDPRPVKPVSYRLQDRSGEPGGGPVFVDEIDQLAGDDVVGP